MDSGLAKKQMLLMLAAMIVIAGVMIPPAITRGSQDEVEAFKSPDDLGNHIFECLQKNDVEAFVSVCLTADEVLELLKSIGLSKEERARAETDLRSKNGADLLLRKARIGFLATQGRLDWAKAGFKGVKSEIRTRNGMRLCEFFDMQIEAEGKLLPMLLEGVVESGGGWKVLYLDGFMIGKDRRHSARPQANETVAIATLRNISSSQAQFQAIAIADVDCDGVGEFGCFRELSGGDDVRGMKNFGRLNPPVLSSAFKVPDKNGVITRSGYHYAIYLPNAAGVGIRADLAGFDKVDADLSETLYCCYAWPVKYGLTGSRSFVINQCGDVMFTESEQYTGAVDPAPDAAFIPLAPDGKGPFRDKGCITDRLAEGTKGRDGNVWRPNDPTLRR